MSFKLDWFLSIIGDSQVEITDDRQSVLYDSAEAFLRAGVALSAQDYATLGEASRAAFIEARNRIRLEEAAQVAYFLTHPAEAVRILKGEDAAVREALEGKLP